MKRYLDQLSKAIEAQDTLLTKDGQFDAAVKKVRGQLLPGAKCSWCYASDAQFWKNEEDYEIPKPEQWPYSGFVVPFPETCGRRQMEVEDVCVVVTDYPIEKENPVTDWVPLLAILAIEDLHEFHVFGHTRNTGTP